MLQAISKEGMTHAKQFGWPITAPVNIIGIISTLKFMRSTYGKSIITRKVVNFAKSCILSCLSIFDNNKSGFTVPLLKYKRLILKLRILLAGHTVSMVNYFLKKMLPTVKQGLGSFLFRDCKIK